MSYLTIRSSLSLVASSTAVTSFKGATLTQVGGGLSVRLSYAPVDVNYDQIGREYVIIDRSGKKGLIAANGDKLRTVTFNSIIADRDTFGAVDVGKTLNDLSRMAEEDKSVYFIYGIRSLPFQSRITEFSYKSLNRTPSGAISQAEISVQLTEAVRIRTTTVTLSPITYTPKATVKKPTKTSSTYSGKGSVTPPIDPPITKFEITGENNKYYINNQEFS